MTRTRLAGLLGGVCALALCACGGGSSGEAASVGSVSAAPSRDTTVPASATASTQSFVDYLHRQSAPDDTIEPLKLQQQLPPLDDTAEPTPIG